MEITPEELKSLFEEGVSPVMRACESLNTVVENFAKSFDVFLTEYERLRDEN